jgi:hypothetical protein
MKGMSAGLLLTAGCAGTADPPGVDVYGDPPPPGAVARLGTVRLRLAGEAARVAYSPDDRTVAAVDCSGDVRVFSTEDGRLVRELPLTNCL